MKTKDFALEVKDLSDEGTFTGYGSVSGNVDSYGERVMPGAFAASLAKHSREGTQVLMFWQHNPSEPIGVWEDLAEDKKGLWGKGRLLMDIQRAREVHVLMKNRAIGGLSIGYREVKVTPADGNILNLDELDLREISPVSFPANRRARIEAVKSDAYMALRQKLLAGDRPSIREIEKGMRDAFDLSISEAERAVRLVFKDDALGEPEKTTDLTAIKSGIAGLRALVDGTIPRT